MKIAYEVLTELVLDAAADLDVTFDEGMTENVINIIRFDLGVEVNYQNPPEPHQMEAFIEAIKKWKEVSH